MTTDTIERTPAEQRKATAAHHVQTLSAELEHLKKRKETSAGDVGRLCDEIAKAERAGAEPKILTALRRDRTEAESVGADLDRVLSNIEAELVPAQAEVRAATIACHAEGYNTLVEKQRALAGVLDEAVATILETIKVKQSLAGRQDDIHGVVGCPNHELSTMGIREVIRQAISGQLAGDEAYGKLPLFSRLDWSCRKMADGGNLLPFE